MLALRLFSGALLLAGCRPAAEGASYTGKALPPIAGAEELDVMTAGDSGPPDGYRIIGVTTASCDTMDGAAGLLEAPCSHEALMDAVRVKAAAVGGSALYDLRCGQSILEKSLEYKDGGVESHARARLSCQASVLRGDSDAPRVAAPRRTGPARGPVMRFSVGGADVEVAFRSEPGRAAPTEREPGSVGELAVFPEGHARLGALEASCLGECAPSTARRGLLLGAAKVGAIAVAELECAPEGERWRCWAVAIDPTEPAALPIASATSDAGEPDTGELDAGAPDAAGAPDTGEPDAAPAVQP